MGLLSPLTTKTSDEPSPDIIEASPVGGEKTTVALEEKSVELTESSLLSPSAVSPSSKTENGAGTEGEGNKDKIWKGDSWSQEDVRYSRSKSSCLPHYFHSFDLLSLRKTILSFHFTNCRTKS